MFRLARKQAELSLRPRAQHGAVLVRGKRILGRGYNRHKHHPTWGSGPWSNIHAEAAAIRDALSRGSDIEGCTMYVVRLKDGELVNSKPCPDCQQLLNSYKIKSRWSL